MGLVLNPVLQADVMPHMDQAVSELIASRTPAQALAEQLQPWPVLAAELASITSTSAVSSAATAAAGGGEAAPGCDLSPDVAEPLGPLAALLQGAGVSEMQVG